MGLAFVDMAGQELEALVKTIKLHFDAKLKSKNPRETYLLPNAVVLHQSKSFLFPTSKGYTESTDPSAQRTAGILKMVSHA